MPITDVVNAPGEGPENTGSTEGGLGQWVMHYMRHWEDVRNTNYRRSWNQYERLWRGIWAANDKQRKSERSRYVSPALSHAIESVVSEIEEAIFSQGRFFDIDPDSHDEDLLAFRNTMYDDMLEADIQTSIREAILNGAIYGTLIGKIVVETTKNKYISPKAVNGLPEVVEAGREEDDKVVTRLIPVSPREFVIDTASKNITDALGVGQITLVPLHIIEDRQRKGIYDPEVSVTEHSGIGTLQDEATREIKGLARNHAKIWEYHGLVPVDMMARHVLGEDYDLVIGDDKDALEDEDDMMEAIVTLANEGDLLRAIPNPNTLGDRNFIAAQFDIVPNKFWGRGIGEKGFNSQMALDHEGRGRQDGMALTIHPMMGIDATMMPKGADVRVRPGRSILTNGDPSAILRPLNFGTIDPSTFTQSADLERQLSKATGAFDDSSVNVNNAKTGAMGMAVSGAIKRTKRTLKNIEDNFITTMVHKFAWRNMQYSPERYPQLRDPQFNVITSQGIVEKEWEKTELGNMMKTVSPDSPAYWLLMKGLFQNSSIKNREQYDQIIDGQLEAAMNPQPSQMEVAQMQAQQAKLRIDMARARAELLRIEMEAQKLETGNLKDYTAAMLNVAKAEAEEAGVDVNKYNATLARIQAGFKIDQEKAARLQIDQEAQQIAAAPDAGDVV